MDIASTDKSESKEPSWTFLTNHTHVMVCLARDKFRSLRLIADEIGITERAVQKIVADLVQAGVITKSRVGRNNHYTLHTDQPLRHTLEKHCTLGQILGILKSD
ncbi:winged helix-turn-helix domain-containing protein [bacterium]|nr:winged helix-turn-helix domain-containing protein [bacterium]